MYGCIKICINIFDTYIKISIKLSKHTDKQSEDILFLIRLEC